MIRKSFFIALLPVFFLAGCFNKMPERLNPLDPQYSKNGIISGVILDKNNNPYHAFYVETMANQDTPFSYSRIESDTGKYVMVKSEGAYNLCAWWTNSGINESYCAYRMDVQVKAGETTKLDMMVKQLFISPKTNEAVSTTPNFSWETYPGAAGYQLVVYKSTNWEYHSQWNSYVITGTSFVFSSAPLDSGFIYHAVLFAYSSLTPWDNRSDLAYSSIKIRVP
jgi:hypothetical protein